MSDTTNESPTADGIEKPPLQQTITSTSTYPGIQFDDDLGPLPKLERTKTWWKLTLRAYDDEDEEDWWFASTAIPLVAATIGPLANVMSIAALVVSWRTDLTPTDGSAILLPQLSGAAIPDPHWCYYINLTSLVCGYVGNIFLLLNFTNRIRYIIALPVTIVLWYASAFLLMGIELAVVRNIPPVSPAQIYSQGFWYGVISAVLYMICAMILMVNMLGYFLGHYPQHFTLTDAQRTLILQTMLFFIWLAGGAGVFSSVEARYGTLNWSFVDALYFCQVTITTIGYGDEVPTDDVGRGLVFPYAVGGIIMLGLMISSISQFAGELSSSHVVRKHAERQRIRTIGRSITEDTQPYERKSSSHSRRMSTAVARAGFAQPAPILESGGPGPKSDLFKAVARTGTMLMSITTPGPRGRKPREIVLREERDRFNAMRSIQKSTTRFKHYTALTISVIAFVFLWAVGAVVFWQAEKQAQGMTYFNALYYCYVSLLTIGYGDFAPKSAAGRPFFVVWSLLAVPTMTILVSDLGSTVIAAFKEGTNTLGDFTLLPKYGIWRDYLDRHPWLGLKIQEWTARRAARKRVARGFATGPDPEVVEAEGGTKRHLPTLDELAKESPSTLNEHELARKLANAIRATAQDLRSHEHKQYSYEEWVEYTRLIRFSSYKQPEGLEVEEQDEGLIEWDWIGDDSPMMTEQTEPEFLLDRLCESMARYIRKQTAKASGQSKSEAAPDERRPLWSLREEDQQRDAAAAADTERPVWSLRDEDQHHDTAAADEERERVGPLDDGPMGL